METHDTKYRTAIKDTDRCLIQKASCEVSEGSDTILSKYITMFKETKDDEAGSNILGIRWALWRELDTYYLFSKNPKYCDATWKGVVSQSEILDYIKNIGVIEGYLHMGFKPVGSPRYHGNPIKGWNDWVQVSAGTRVMICQFFGKLLWSVIQIESKLRLESML